MIETIRLVGESGILVALAALFIWEKIDHVKTVNKVLSELQETAKRQTALLESLKIIAESTRSALNIVQTTLTSLVQLLDRHDKRSESMHNDVVKILENSRKENK